MSRQEEHHAQAALVRWLAAKGVIAMAIPNAARRSARQAAYLKAEGMIAGAPDLILSRLTETSGDWSPVAIEMKRAKGGRTTPAQDEMHARLRAERWAVLVCRGLDDAIRQVSHVYGWPVPQSSSLPPSPPPAPKRARATGRRTASGATSTPVTSPPSSLRTPTRVRRVDLP